VDATSSGPLAGIRVLDLGGIGPPTFAAMLLGDLGADVVRVDRVGAVDEARRSSDFLLRRGARSTSAPPLVSKPRCSWWPPATS
jgi:alpha-methylacyl-CoA racemase